MIKIIVSLIIFFSISFPVIILAAGPSKENLLAHSSISLEHDLSLGIDKSKEKNLRDNNDNSIVQVEAKSNAPVELVYFFDSETVSPERLKIKINGIENNQAKIEILVSSLSSSAGYSSLRVEPLKKSSGWQSFSFEQTAAKWVMIKILPFDQDVTVDIAEIELQGHVGSPVTSYKFDESPAAAFDVLAQLKGSVDVDITEDEASLFDDARDGKLDQWSFAEASLLSSGVLDKNARKKYLQQIDQLEREAKKIVSPDKEPFEQGKELLTWLHSGVFNQGYVERQTDVSSVLDGNTFNCVSSSTLYNILARRIGLDARGIEVPDHAFSILYDGTNHADIETTTKNGFNPARNRAGLSEFEKQTGFVYIPDKNRSKRREVDETGLVAITYYNHGVGFSEKKQYKQALLNYFRALSLDPKNNSAIKNSLAVLATWSAELSDAGDFDKALTVLEAGLTLAPDDRTLRHNNKVVWQQKVNQSLDNENPTEALSFLKIAYQKTQDKDFVRLQSWVFLKQGEDFIEQDNWEQALAVALEGAKNVDDHARKDIIRWRNGVILRWSNQKMDQKNFSVAVDILEKGLAFDKPDYRVENNLGYITQEWSQYVSDTEGVDAARELISMLSKRFPELRKVQKAGRGFSDREAKEAIEQGDFERAIAIYDAGLQEKPDDSLLRKNQRATWVQWAKADMDARDWEAALNIYEKAYKADPKASVFKRNIEYIVQEWGRDLSQQKDAFAAEEMVANSAARFPEISGLERSKGNNINRAVKELVDKGEYEKALDELTRSKDAFSSASKYQKLVFNIYYSWAKPHSDKEEWEEAIAVYTNGFERYPDNSKIERNLVASWHSVAKPLMDAEKWKQAIAVYEEGLETIPDSSLFKKNIRYCESKLNAK